MSQHDLTIDDQGFPSFRSDLNSALQALGSTNSGTSAPSTTFANQLFYDTTNNILKIRNEDNDAFINLFTLDQTNDNIEALTIDGTLTYNGDLVSSTAGTSNFRAGVNAGNSIASGSNYNTVVGDEAGTAISTGDFNTFIGYIAGDAIDTSSENVAIGANSLTTDTKGSKSVAVGKGSLGSQNFSSATDSHNTAIGYESGKDITTGTQNTLIGSLSGDAMTTAVDNVAVGYLSMSALTDADYNVAVGKGALSDDTQGSKSTGIGYQALSSQNFTSATDTHNTAVGYNAGSLITTGIKNTIMGSEAGDALTDADFNVAIGTNALGNDQKGNRNTAVGHGALATQQFTSSQDSGNTAVGFGTGNAITDGVQNVFIGIDAGKNATTCNNVVAIGISAGGNSTLTGNNNVMVGNSAGAEITSGVNNICLGQDSGRAGKPGGALITTSNNICLGDSAISGFHCQVGITVASDERDKTDFKDLDLGLDFVNDLKPYTYKWDKRVNYGDSTDKDYDFSTQTPDGTHKEDWLDVGFKAQDVEVLEKANGYDKDKKTNLLISSVDEGKQYGMRYEKFVPILVKAIQELSAKNDALEARIKTLEG